jgi:hypothetical protein
LQAVWLHGRAARPAPMQLPRQFHKPDARRWSAPKASTTPPRATAIPTIIPMTKRNCGGFFGIHGRQEMGRACYGSRALHRPRPGDRTGAGEIVLYTFTGRRGEHRSRCDPRLGGQPVRHYLRWRQTGVLRVRAAWCPSWIRPVIRRCRATSRAGPARHASTRTLTR